MKTTQQQVAELLTKLGNATERKKNVKRDYAAAKKMFWKPKDGKNQILIFTPAFATDPFTIWGFHKGLQEVDYYSVPCDSYNHQEECVICNVVKGLKDENWEGNKHLWMPIEQRTETYAPIIDLSSEATKAEGPKWFRISKTIMGQLVQQLKNLEDGELPFYDESAPQRIILDYDKNQTPQQQYSVSFKEMKDKPSVEQIAEWANTIQPVGNYIFSKTQDENKKLVDEYFGRMAALLDEAADKKPDDGSADNPRNTTDSVDAEKVDSKLSRLKK